MPSFGKLDLRFGAGMRRLFFISPQIPQQQPHGQFLLSQRLSIQAPFGRQAARALTAERDPPVFAPLMRQQKTAARSNLATKHKSMGIDIYARWDKQTPEEVQPQYQAAFSVEAGDIGYLREAYHGEPYATRHLVPEAFENPKGALIPAKTLRERLPETLRLAEERERTLYETTTSKQIEPVLKSFTAFVELCERQEAKTGKPVKILAFW